MTSPDAGPAGPQSGRLRSILNRPGQVVAAVLVVGTILLVGFRLYLSVDRTGPIVVADEIGYLLNARVLTGGVEGYLTRASVYTGGYSLALIPAFLLGGGPEATYRLVLGTNAVLAAAVFPLLYLTLRRGFAMARTPSLICALAGALYAPLSGFATVALSENLLTPLLVAWLLLLVEFLRARALASAYVYAVAVGLAAGWLYATHSRMLPIVAIQLGLLVLLAARRHVRIGPALLGMSVTVISCAAAYALNAYLYRRNWPGKVLDQRDRAIENLFSRDGLAERVQFVAGECAYLFLATFGLAAVAVVVLIVVGSGPGSMSMRERLRATWRAGTRDGFDADHTRAVIAWVILLVLTGLLAITGAASGELSRPDYRIYGRYVEIIAPLLVAVGIAALRSWLPTRLPIWTLLTAGVALTGLATVVVLDGADDAFQATNIGWANVTGLILLGGMEGIDPARYAVVALLILLVIGSPAPARLRVVTALGTCALLIWGSVHIDSNIYDPGQRRNYPARATIDDFQAIADADEIAFDGARLTQAEFIYQFYLDHTTFQFFDSQKDLAPTDADIVISTDSWPGSSAPGVELIWRDPVFGFTAWKPAGARDE